MLCCVCVLVCERSEREVTGECDAGSWYRAAMSFLLEVRSEALRVFPCLPAVAAEVDRLDASIIDASSSTRAGPKT